MAASCESLGAFSPLFILLRREELRLAVVDGAGVWAVAVGRSVRACLDFMETSCAEDAACQVNQNGKRTTRKEV